MYQVRRCGWVFIGYELVDVLYSYEYGVLGDPISDVQSLPV